MRSRRRGMPRSTRCHRPSRSARYAAKVCGTPRARSGSAGHQLEVQVRGGPSCPRGRHVRSPARRGPAALARKSRGSDDRGCRPAGRDPACTARHHRALHRQPGLPYHVQPLALGHTVHGWTTTPYRAALTVAPSRSSPASAPRSAASAGSPRGAGETRGDGRCGPGCRRTAVRAGPCRGWGSGSAGVLWTDHSPRRGNPATTGSASSPIAAGQPSTPPSLVSSSLSCPDITHSVLTHRSPTGSDLPGWQRRGDAAQRTAGYRPCRSPEGEILLVAGVSDDRTAAAPRKVHSCAGVTPAIASCLLTVPGLGMEHYLSPSAETLKIDIRWKVACMRR